MSTVEDSKAQKKVIDELFLRAIETVAIASKDASIKPNTPRGIVELIYPNSSNYFYKIKNGKGSIPRIALMNFAKIYNVDMNYFFHENKPFVFDLNYFFPEKKYDTNTEIDEIFNSSLNSEPKTFFLQQGLQSFESDFLSKRFRINEVIELFSKTLKEESKTTLYNLLGIIQTVYLNKIESLNKINELTAKNLASKEEENEFLKKLLVDNKI